MKVDEINDLKPKIIKDLKDKGVRVIDLGSGTFDLFIDNGKGYFIELKVLNEHYKRFAGKKGINLSSQTSAIRALKNLPIIFACSDEDIDNCYLVTPEELKRLAKERKKFPDILIGEDNLESISYKDELKKLIGVIIKDKKSLK